MATIRGEIIADFQEHIRKEGGAGSDWCIGTAQDPRGPFFRRHLVADLGDGMVYREAFTPETAQAICDHFVNDCGLERDEADTGKIVFLYKRGKARPEPPPPAPAPPEPPQPYLFFRRNG